MPESLSFYQEVELDVSKALWSTIQALSTITYMVIILQVSQRPLNKIHFILSYYYFFIIILKSLL